MYLFSIVSFKATVGFTIGKLFPNGPNSFGYFCESHGLSCIKVVHNATMTLSCFVFDFLETWLFHLKAKDIVSGSVLGLKCKIGNIVLGLAYIIYEAGTEDVSSPRALAIVLAASISEAILLTFETWTLRDLVKDERRRIQNSCSSRWIAPSAPNGASLRGAARVCHWGIGNCTARAVCWRSMRGERVSGRFL